MIYNIHGNHDDLELNGEVATAEIGDNNQKDAESTIELDMRMRKRVPCLLTNLLIDR